MKPSGPGLLLVGRFFITVLIFVLVIVLFRCSISYWFSFGRLHAKSLQSCLTVQPYGQQPTRLLCPQDSPDKNTGVGCHFLLQCMKVKSESEVAQSCPTLSDPVDCSPPGSSIHGFLQARVLEWVPLPSLLEGYT